MNKQEISLDELKDLVQWLNVSEDIRVFSLRYRDMEIYISRNEESGGPTEQRLMHPPITAEPAPSDDVVARPTPEASVQHEHTPVQELEAAENEVLVKAPLVGIFYATPKPGAPPFVIEGQTVRPDSVLGIIEVMKLMTNIEAKVDGVVKRVFVENQQPVEFGQPLMLIERG